MRKTSIMAAVLALSFGLVFASVLGLVHAAQHEMSNDTMTAGRWNDRNSCG